MVLGDFYLDLRELTSLSITLNTHVTLVRADCTLLTVAISHATEEHVS